MTNTATSPVLRRLNADWEALADQPPDWPSRFGATLGQVHAAVAAQPDQVLAELIAACQAGSAHAGRVAVQALLGGLVGLTRRDRRVTLDDAVAQLWLLLTAYRLDRRPARIALNLVWDTRKAVLRELAGPLVAGPPPEPPGPTADSVLAEAARLGLAPPRDLALAASVYADGLTSARAAATYHLTPAAVRWRCRQVVLKLRPHRAALADVTPLHPGVWALS